MISNSGWTPFNIQLTVNYDYSFRALFIYPVLAEIIKA